MPHGDTEWTHFHCYFICLAITPFSHLYIKWKLWAIQGKTLLSYNRATQLDTGAMNLFGAWRDTVNTNSNSCNMKKSLWWPNYMPNVLGIDLLGSKCSLYNGMETICSVDKYKPRLHCCWWVHLTEWFYAQTFAFVLHDLVTITVNMVTLSPLWAAVSSYGESHSAITQIAQISELRISAVLSSYSAWIQAMSEQSRFCFWLTLRTAPAEKSHNHQKLFLSHRLLLKQWDFMHDPLSSHSGRNKNHLVLGMQLPPNSPRSPCIIESWNHKTMES